MEGIVKIQEIIAQSGQTLLSFIKVIMLSKFRVKTISPRKEEVVIMGNGPSLKHDIEKHKAFLHERDLVCVNHFPVTDFYQELKPSLYVTSAPEIWDSDIKPEYVALSDKLLDTMNKTTNWNVALFIPFEAKKFSRWHNHIRHNNNIRLHYYNNVGVEGFKWLTHFLFSKGIGMPRPHNVLVTSIYLCINMGYKKIYLLGADHSWLKDLSVSEDNQALLNQKHFYDENSSKPDVMRKRGQGQRHLHEILHKFVKTFEGYFILKDYAESKKVKIYNATKGSFIDAFDRVDLEQMSEMVKR